MTDENTTATPEPAKGKGKTMRVIENVTLPLSSIILPEQWNREDPGKLDSLKSSLTTHGQLVALTIRPGEKPGTYELVDGRRRYLAMKELNWKEAKVSISESADSTDAYAKSFVANLHRLQHNPVEISNIFSTLSETLKNKDIAKLCDVSEGFVSQHLTIRKLPKKFLDALKKGTLLMAEARELCRLDVEEDAEFLDKVGTQLVDGELDAFTGAEKISLYLQRKDAKDSGKESKGKSKGKSKAKAEGGRSQGRPPKTTDYADADVKAKISPRNKTELVEYLTHFSGKLAKTSSEANRRYLKGVVDGLEMAGSLRDLE
jgi:ParB/RepB/Spo0J family partition protein